MKSTAKKPNYEGLNNSKKSNSTAKKPKVVISINMIKDKKGKRGKSC